MMRKVHRLQALRKLFASTWMSGQSWQEALLCCVSHLIWLLDCLTTAVGALASDALRQHAAELCSILLTEESCQGKVSELLKYSTGHVCIETTPSNGADMLPSEVEEIVEQMPALVVFSGGTAFNSVAGDTHDA